MFYFFCAVSALSSCAPLICSPISWLCSIPPLISVMLLFPLLLFFPSTCLSSSWSIPIPSSALFLFCPSFIVSSSFESLLRMSACSSFIAMLTSLETTSAKKVKKVGKKPPRGPSCRAVSTVDQDQSANIGTIGRPGQLGGSKSCSCTRVPAGHETAQTRLSRWPDATLFDVKEDPSRTFVGRCASERCLPYTALFLCSQFRPASASHQCERYRMLFSGLAPDGLNAAEAFMAEWGNLLANSDLNSVADAQQEVRMWRLRGSRLNSADPLPPPSLCAARHARGHVRRPS